MGLNDPTQRLPAVPPRRPGGSPDDSTVVLPVVPPVGSARPESAGPRRPPKTLPGVTVPPLGPDRPHDRPAPGQDRPRNTETSTAPSRAVRVLETVAGLLSSGLLVLTVVLLAAVVVAPLVVDGASGPQWWRIGVCAAVAVPGELIRIGRRQRAPWLRLVLAGSVSLAVLGALALTWWW